MTSGRVVTGRVAAAGLSAATPGLHRVRRPEDDRGPAFDLTYVRTGPRTGAPVVVIPGGPGLGSVLPYRGLRRRAARLGLNLIMVEHRGVGLSRRDLRGRDLPGSAMRVTAVVDDIAAVLDREGVSSAHIVGSSYGSYVAATFGALHPGRVVGMILDSALQSATDLPAERRMVRSLFWDADTAIAADVRRLHSQGVGDRTLLDVVRAAYELGGDDLLAPLLRERLRTPRGPGWRILQAYATRDEDIAHLPFLYEFDLAGVIGFRELGYGSPPDGLPLDPALTYSLIADRFPAFEAEPVNLGRAVRGFTWPVVLLSGTRDLRTPPEIAERVAAAAPEAVLVPLENGHSVLDTHSEALLHAIGYLVSDRYAELAGQGAVLDALPRRGLTARAPDVIAMLLRAERSLRRR